MSLGVVAAGHEVTASAAEEALRAGGNAFDAVLAAFTASCVAEPVLASLGGGAFLMAAKAGEKPVVYDFFSQTPIDMPDKAALDFHGILADFGEVKQEFHVGKASISTPGAVKGIFEAHGDLGRLPMADVFAPAIAAAKNGVEMNAYQARLLNVVVGDIFRAGEGTRALFASKLKDGQLAQESEVITNPDTADFLEVLAIEGQDLFYRGEPAQRFCRDMQDGGVVTMQDMESYEVVRRTPLELSYHDTKIEMNPPPSAGGLLMAFGLKLLEQSDIRDLRVGSDAYLMLMADVLDKTLQARADLEAGGKTAECLLDETYLDMYRQQVLNHARSIRGTTHISVIDKDHNMASLTASNGQGEGYVLPGTGIVMNNMLGEGDLSPQGFHNYPLNTRLSSMMCPSMILWPDGRRVATGSGGSNRIRTAILQVLVHLIDHGMSIEDAVAAPRIHFENDTLDIEGGFNGELSQLCETYPQHNRWQEQNMFFGGVHTVGVSERGFSGAGDPRRSGVCKVL